MALSTITYSDNSGGWTSFWDYYPDWMIGLSNVFYSWKNGSLYQHNLSNTRCIFYGVQVPSIVKTIFNEDPFTTKMFKSVSLDSTSPWTATLITDLDYGSIASTEYVEKEGTWFGYARALNSTSNSLNLLSTQGVGSISTVSGATATFGFNITTRLGVGDRVYVNNAFIGTIVSATATTITITGGVFTGLAGGYVRIEKNSIAESYGLRGYYMDIELEITSQNEVELFSISSSLFKSYM
jgi:preprotein translocase subunit YajC